MKVGRPPGGFAGYASPFSFSTATQELWGAWPVYNLCGKAVYEILVKSSTTAHTMFGTRDMGRKTVTTARRWTCEKLPDEQTVPLSRIFELEVSGCELQAFYPC
jgi:hypothetical protein